MRRRPAGMTIDEAAPAKINLALHVTGRRSDGYHLLDSLVVFVGVGDRIQVSAAESTNLAVSGPMAAGVPVGPENLVLRAATLFQPAIPARITLTKHLPAAAGIGGGSADAAACLRALAELGGRELPSAEAALSLGADVPACLMGRTLRMGGVGEDLAALPPLPPLWLVLVNPRVSVSTPAVFAHLRDRANAPMSALPNGAGQGDFLDWLQSQRNDLQDAACHIAPIIRDVLEMISETSGCRLARMSGSGATFFGVFTGPDAADDAARQIVQACPDWWCQTAPVLTSVR